VGTEHNDENADELVGYHYVNKTHQNGVEIARSAYWLQQYLDTVEEVGHTRDIKIVDQSVSNSVGVQIG